MQAQVGLSPRCHHFWDAGAACARLPHPVSVGAGCWAPVAHSCWLHLPAWLPYRNKDLHGRSLAPRSLRPLRSRAVELAGTSSLPKLLWGWVSCSRVHHGSTASRVLGAARAVPGPAAPRTVRISTPAPMCGLQHGQAGARGRFQGARRVGGDPMTLSNDLPPHPSPPRAALMGISLPRS